MEQRNQTIKLPDLLAFLDGKSNWTLSCDRGKYTLRFPKTRKRRLKRGSKKKRGSESTASGGDIVTAPSIRGSRPRPDDALMRAKWLEQVRGSERPTKVAAEEEGEDDESTLNDDLGGVKAALPRRLLAASRDGTVDSCDSLLWDDYDVGTCPPEADQQDCGLIDALMEFEDEDGDDDDPPDNLRDGLRLLREMKDLRQEIRKMGDATAVVLSTSSPKPMPKVAARRESADSSEIRELKDALQKQKNESAAAASTATENPWDSGYVGDSGEDEGAPVPSEDGLPDLEPAGEILTSDKVAVAEAEQTVKLDNSSTQKAVRDVGSDANDISARAVKAPQPPRKKLSKSQKRRDKRQQKKNAKGAEARTDSNKPAADDPPERRREHVLESTCKELEKSNPMADFLFNELSGAVDKAVLAEAKEVLMDAFGSGSRWVKSPASRRVGYKEPFDWEFGFCRGEEKSFDRIMARKRMRQFRLCQN